MPSKIGLDYKPLESPLLENPHPFYARLRREAPVTFAPAFQFWLVSRYQDVQTVLKDSRRFSSRDALRPPLELPPAIQAILKEADYSPDYPLLGDDPPGHTRVRGLVGKAFTIGRVESLAPRIRAIANTHLDNLMRKGSGADFIPSLAGPVPMQVITEMLGIPERDREQLRKWCDDEKLFFIPNLPPEQHLRVARGAADFRIYLRRLIEDRRKFPGSDLLTSLLDARMEGERPLSTQELVALSCVIMFAGQETTTNLLGATVLHLLRHPGLWQELRKNPSGLRNAIEEVMRFDAPVVGMMRTTTEPVMLSGTSLPAGARLFLLFASANHDEDFFEQPGRFDIHRANAVRHLGFGHGIHYCVGSPLARLEAQITLELMLERLPDLRLVPGETVPYLPNLFHRGPRSLRVKWGA
jgi:cytochrome P450